MTKKIIGVGLAFPGRTFSQDEVYDQLYGKNQSYKAIFKNSLIDKRHVYVNKLSELVEKDTNKIFSRFKEGTIKLAIEAAKKSLINYSNLEINNIFTTYSSGYLCPGLDVYLINELGLTESINHFNLAGMGCSGAATALSQINNFTGNTLIVASELCSSACFLDDTTETAIANAIFGDGAGAVLISSDPNIPGFEILDTYSLLQTEYINKMGLDLKDGKMRIFLKKEVPQLVGNFSKKVITKLLEKNNLKKEDINYWIIHPGGKNILEEIEKNNEFTKSELRYSYEVLRNYGNLASAGWVFVLENVFNSNPKKGEKAVILGIGSGMKTDAILVEWT